jgi:antitoxin FitA
MPSLQIRDVPEEVRATLAARARARGQSLQAFLLWLVEEEAHRAQNVAVLERFAGRDDGTRVSTVELADAVNEARAERDVQLPHTAHLDT